MKRMITGLMVILLMISCAAFPQERADTPRMLSGFHFGMSYLNLKDEVLNNAIHKGSGISGAIYLERSDNMSVKRLDLELESGFLKSNFESEASSYMFSGSAGFTYLRNLCHAEPGIRFYLGGKVKTGTAIEYFDNWDESHFYWITAYSIGAGFRIDYSLGNNSKIRMEGDFPVFSLVSRPPAEFLYTQSSPALPNVIKDLNHDLRLLSPARYQELNLRLKYSFGNPKKFVPGVFWRLSYLTVDKDGSGKLKYLNQTFGVEFIF
jgi:hypothetical protein